MTKAQMNEAARKKAYGDLNLSSANPNLKKALILLPDATWHLYRTLTDAAVPRDYMTAWSDWEEFSRKVPFREMQMQHEQIWKLKPDKDLDRIQLAVYLYAYRCSKAIDHTSKEAEEASITGNPMSGQRRSSIAGRRYKLLDVPSGLTLEDGKGITDNVGKKVTGKQGLVCYRLAVEALNAAKGEITEDKMREHMEANAAKITDKVDSAWRFFQFYRPILVAAGLMEYHK